MKRHTLFATLILSAITMQPVLADEAHHTNHNQKTGAPAADQTPQKMQANMMRMHDQMHKIMDAKNPQDRERLMQEHSKMMQESMPMMSGTSGSGKMDGGMKAK